MALKRCAPWIWEGAHEVSLAEAEAVEGLFASLSKADAETEAEKDQPLHKVAFYAKGQYAMVVFGAVLNAFPSAVKEKNEYRCLPLHIVAECMGIADGGLEAIRRLLGVYPQAARAKDLSENLPIHRICYNKNATLAMVRKLLSAHPQSISEQGYKRMTPYAMSLYVSQGSMRLPADAIEFLRLAEQGASRFSPSLPTPRHRDLLH
jgi:ankyrin repeat protein